MKSTYKNDRSLEDKFSKTIKAILGNQFITKDIEMDLKRGTDFLIFNVNPFKIGVRLRRYQYYKNVKYRNQFTIRWSRPSGVKTEIHKIMDGYVDYILYGFINECEEKIIKYFIGDLEVFRNTEAKPVSILPNHPHDSDLAVFNVFQFPVSFILKSYEYSNNIKQ